MNNVHPLFSNILSSFAASTTAAATPAKSSREFGDFDSHVKGIPCQVVIDSCTVVKGSFSRNAPSDLDYHGYSEVEFHLLDRKGYSASWLESKMSDADRDRIEGEVLSHNSEK